MGEGSRHAAGGCVGVGPSGATLVPGAGSSGRRWVALLAATTAGTVAGGIPAAGQVTTPEGWVGCWSLEIIEPWAPAVDRPGFPSAEAMPAPRIVLLDRLPGRAGLLGRDGPRSFRAEWEDPALRNLEAWALRADDHVYLEATPGLRELTLLLEGPPEPVIPARWFFRRTDTPLPEIRSMVAASRTPCPEGRAPHREEERAELQERFQAHGVEGTFVLYDTSARRLVRVDPRRATDRFRPGPVFGIAAKLQALRMGAVEPETALPWDLEAAVSRLPGGGWSLDLGRYGNRQFSAGEGRFWETGDLRISADEKVAWLADVVRDRSIPATRPGQGVQVDPVRALAGVLAVAGRGGARLHALGGWVPDGESAVGWKAGWLERDGSLLLFALNLTGGAGVEHAEADLPGRLAVEILEALGALPADP
jgi:beta-lactamase class D